MGQMQIINIKISNITSSHNNRLFGEMTKMINYFKYNLLSTVRGDSAVTCKERLFNFFLRVKAGLNIFIG